MGILIRKLVQQDREAVHGMLKDCGAFTTDEVKVALELLDEGTASNLDGDYCLFAAELNAEISGYVCVGKTPLTASTWHLYWICVHPRTQRAGVGIALQCHAEHFIRERGGKRVVLETSSQPSYMPTRRFYEKAGYHRAGSIPDFYKPGDDCIIYFKEL